MPGVRFSDSSAGITAAQLADFSTHWLHRPSPANLMRILNGSDHVVLAIDAGFGRVLGYITAITDGVSCAYIPHLEVLESLRGQGIGRELVRLSQASHLMDRQMSQRRAGMISERRILGVRQRLLCRGGVPV